ncbi:MAG: hypothetical protein ACXACG_02800 [Candidatus Thorarchaeota archaeon]|jgi:ssDNA-binding replication factor A large subunit
MGESIIIQEADWIPISKLTVESRAVNVRFSVINIGSSRQVTAKATGKSHLITECVVGDESAIITLTLWNYDIDEIETGKTYELVNGYISLYDESMSLSKGRWGIIRVASSDIVKVDETINMSRPFQQVVHFRELQEENRRVTAHRRAFEVVLA